MRHVSIYSLGFAALLAIAVAAPPAAQAEDGTIQVDACASDPKRLGLSRIVEVDTEGGAAIAGSQPASTHFLKDGEVVLTFDDGPVKKPTREVLKALADQCTKATFFMVGRMALLDPEMVREVTAAGHTIGSHTWSHRNLRPAPLMSARQEVESAISTISKANGQPIAPLFRFPYLSSNKQVDAYLKSRNIAAVWVDVDSKDYTTHDPHVLEQRIITQLVARKKGIILMHDIHAWTARMLPELLDDLRTRGFKVVHMVTKAPVQTIPSFDDAAEKAIAAKTAARHANPVAALPKDEPADQQGSSRGRRLKTKPSIIEGVPEPAAKADATTTKPKKSAKPKDDDLPGQSNPVPN